MNQLASRKKLLIAESELNRAQLVQECQAMTDEVHSLTNQARIVRSLTSAAISLISGLVSLRQKKPAPAGEKLPWWQVAIKGTQLVGSLWSEFRTRPKS